MLSVIDLNVRNCDFLCAGYTISSNHFLIVCFCFRWNPSCLIRVVPTWLLEGLTFVSTSASSGLRSSISQVRQETVYPVCMSDQICCKEDQCFWPVFRLIAFRSFRIGDWSGFWRECQVPDLCGNGQKSQILQFVEKQVIHDDKSTTK